MGCTLQGCMYVTARFWARSEVHFKAVVCVVWLQAKKTTTEEVEVKVRPFLRNSPRGVLLPMTYAQTTRAIKRFQSAFKFLVRSNFKIACCLGV